MNYIPQPQQSFNGLAVEFIQHNSELWLTGEQIGRALEYSEPRKRIFDLYTRNQEELDRYSCVLNLRTQDVNGHEQRREVRIFNEEGVMVLTMLSSQPKAAEFRKWAVQVIKGHRNAAPGFSIPKSLPEALEAYAAEIRAKETLAQEKAALEAKALADAPKVEFAKQVERAKDSLSIQEFAASLGIKGMGQNNLFDWLLTNGYLMRSKGKGTPLPMRQYIEAGHFQVIEKAFEDRHGIDRLAQKVLITGKGQIYFTKRIKESLEPIGDESHA
ncbi:MAG: hypothetical protein A2600_13795 [Candidatus Lambdaproteobacteria bacterium RIFOXYD1_FULL_56_27]|uniref:Bro-N domain-containing protein n=1 Tax=Candidatus Lambdaproteobacteria bacterium RIFOXYD2_FULL_56_26 TaxID=1817773 RepID=A0A1F6GLJ6_9PROT|nr:MAG: hypothetical protein A2557_00565 [Candidatus Lambdaproteobacteria bacterium RIFOXYD2_FULL_56_26]OGH01563.1 MAG: hypothetical protein A2426_11355 [Candidatus Lambdaproteobacteria bacterium RIFOXYC1_FULL_56_13]OGH08827.1 MAG: hypothetical protein A2600_13795 [Candidatus Lambdaproteobacteria bacterium RIFOXYD1_FULL_56_27]